MLDAGELELLAAACREHDVVALTDEVYEHLVFDGEHIPIATLPGMAERTLTVSSIGKTHSVTGWKVGWAIGPGRAGHSPSRASSSSSPSPVGRPFQHAAPRPLSLPDDVVGGLARSLREKRDRLAGGLRDAGFEVLGSQAHLLPQRRRRAASASTTRRRCASVSRTRPASSRSRRLGVRSRSTSGRTRSLIRFAFPKRDEVIDEAIDRLARWASRRR